MDVLVVFLLVLIANLIAVYEVNCFLLLHAKIKWFREAIQCSDFVSSSSWLVLRKPRFRVQRAEQRFWIRSGRTRTWLDSFVSNAVLAEEWKENFKMSRGTFLSLCDELGPHIDRSTTKMRAPVEIDRQVTLTLYYLADEGRMRKTAYAFGLSRSSVSAIVRRVCRAFCEHLRPVLICVPATEVEVEDKTKKFLSVFTSSVYRCS